MNTTPTKLTDRAALARNRARIKPIAMDGPFFLHALAVAEINERLIEVNRSFTNPCIVTGFPELWAKIFPEAKVVSDVEVLEIEPGAHDLVIHAMCLHWANDPVGQLIQARLGLRADGLFIAMFPAGETLAPLRAALAEAEAAETGGLSPRMLPMGEIRDLGALLGRAGFALPVADTVPQEVSYADTLALMRDLRAMGESNAMEGRLRSFTRKSVIFKAAARHDEIARSEDGRVRARFEIVFLTGWAAAKNQQKPLRPGSALTRLADALGTEESKIQD